MEKEIGQEPSNAILKQVEYDENFKDDITICLWQFGYIRVEGKDTLGKGFIFLENEEKDLKVRVLKANKQYFVSFGYDGKWVQIDVYSKKAEVIPGIIACEGMIEKERIIERGQQLLAQQNL